jgi:5-methylcytosine-specific restriction endonuclease McrA
MTQVEVWNADETLLHRVTVRYVEQRWLYSRTRATYSREGVLLRDRGRCAYCGRFTATTMDHVRPRSRGGATSWANAVAACEPCNARKGDRTPEEAGMPLRWQPYVPTRVELHFAREALDLARTTSTTRTASTVATTVTTAVTTAGKEPDR